MKMIKIMGYGGGPGCCFGNTYKGKFKVTPNKETKMYKIVALKDSTREYGDKVMREGETSWVGFGLIQEMY